MDTHRWPSGVYAQDPDGRWAPAVPLPYVHGPSWRWSIKVCDCGRKFLTVRRYETHYRTVHLGGC